MADKTKVLIDTSAFVDFIRHGDDVIEMLFKEKIAYIHPFVAGELLLGGYPKDSRIMELILKRKEPMTISTNSIEMMIDRTNAVNKRIGLIDCYLIAACMSESMKLYTKDKNLAALAKEHSCLYNSQES